MKIWPHSIRVELLFPILHCRKTFVFFVQLGFFYKMLVFLVSIFTLDGSFLTLICPEDVSCLSDGRKLSKSSWIKIWTKVTGKSISS